jgi:hypothetical protein
MEKKPITQETLAKLKLKARSNLATSGMKDQVQDQQLIEKEDIDKIGKLKKEGSGTWKLRRRWVSPSPSSRMSSRSTFLFSPG